MPDYKAKRLTSTYAHSNTLTGRQGWFDPGDPITIYKEQLGRGLFDVYNKQGINCGGLWVDMQDLDPVLPPPAPGGIEYNRPMWLSSNIRARYAGVHCLNDGAAAHWAASNGCKFIVMMDNPIGAVQLAEEFPDCMVLSRKWYAGKPTPQQAADDNSGPDPINLCRITTLNEGDYQGYGDEASCTAKFQWERDYAEACWARGAKLVSIGEFSQGTPNFLDPNILNYVNKLYFSKWVLDNAHRLRVGWHLYANNHTLPGQLCGSPNNPIDDPMWFQGRHREFWARAGKPAIRMLSVENGIEAGGGSVGGGYGYGRWPVDMAMAFLDDNVNYHYSLAINDGLWMDGLALFTFSQNGNNWEGGYGWGPYKDALKAFWQRTDPIKPWTKPAARGLSLSAEPVINMPPRKQHYQ